MAMEYNNSQIPQNPNVPNYPVPTNKTNQTLIFIIVILLLIIAGGGAFVFARYIYSPKPALDISTQQPAISQTAGNPAPVSNSSFSNLATEKVSTPPAAVDETANWKTRQYSDYSLKIPRAWFNEDSSKSFAQLTSYNPVGVSGDYDPAKNKGFLKLEIYQENSALNLDDYVKANHEKSKNDLYGNSTVFTDFSTLVGNERAIKSKSSANANALAVYVKHPTKHLFLNIILYFDLTGNETLINQILSTFKFP